MGSEILRILDFMGGAFLHIWPYLLITIPIAVAVNMSGASQYIKRAFDAGPIKAIILATAVGALSPFCSCGVIPIIAALLISGVPLAPVMSFWIASPSMDPEIFFLSVATIGWNLAIWRLAGTFVLSLAAGFITHVAVQRQWLSHDVMRSKNRPTTKSIMSLTKNGLLNLKHKAMSYSPFGRTELIPVPVPVRYKSNAVIMENKIQSAYPGNISTRPLGLANIDENENCGCSERSNFLSRLLSESVNATVMVLKFMALAFFLEAIIILYVPAEWITGVMGRHNSWAIITAAILGIPTYTSNLSALPMISGLLTQGMSPAAALAFLVAGPTTTLPAMAAVWSLVSPRVFVLYVSFVLVGAIILGYLKFIIG
jgi:uncharacterized membrane protein YraQ (UPF0718 family)